MVHVTERAKEELLRKKQSAKIHDPGVGLRLATAASGRLTLVADRAKAGDQIVTHKDSTVLLVDPQTSELVLAGGTVDCRATDDGKIELIVSRSRTDEQPDGEGPR
ncbi:MAG: hypothetical protein HYU51_18615 [Candidatus Rokubacteria bacterium]|nr:hypothetical protein [Candidatus Rokubacteria bacterium]